MPEGIQVTLDIAVAALEALPELLKTQRKDNDITLEKLGLEAGIDQGSARQRMHECEKNDYKSVKLSKLLDITTALRDLVQKQSKK